ncbi:hypothetical protein B0H10DRAFT_2438797 [Mycena sp. CBHHK59/15]|nr:hypothetical protein B0H10DRAFT_2438797 [Mycena sp. CBHHK59/15]
MVSISLAIDNAENMLKSFLGANIVFAVTNFNEHFDEEREIAEGKMMVNKQKQQSKAKITAYERASGIPLVFIQADGSYLFTLPIAGSTLVPLIDVESDYRMYIRATIETPALGADSEVMDDLLGVTTSISYCHKSSSSSAGAAVDAGGSGVYEPCMAPMSSAVAEHLHSTRPPVPTLPWLSFMLDRLAVQGCHVVCEVHLLDVTTTARVLAGTGT